MTALYQLTQEQYLNISKTLYKNKNNIVNIKKIYILCIMI
jgi:hypothetical protein